MKQILLTIALVMISVCAFADNSTKVTEGNASFLKKEATANVVFNWDKAEWDNGRETLKEHWGDDYDKTTKRGEEAFVRCFNENSKKVKISDAPAQYRIEVNMGNIDYFFSAMSFVPGHKHRVSAIINVIDTATGNKVCTITVDARKGGRDFVVSDSFVKAMEQVGEDVAKLK